MTIDAVLLDVGGVLLLPDPEVVGPSLTAVGVDHDPAALASAHYGGVAALDALPAQHWPQGGAPGPYVTGFLEAAGVPRAQQDTAAAALTTVFSRPAIDVWRHEAPGARAGLDALAAQPRPVAVVSNADGTVEEQLRTLGLAQLGPGPGLAVTAVVDSWILGVAKPDPAVFAPALEALGVAPGRCLYVGDTVTFDVTGARAAGLRVVHLDPTGDCHQRDDHPHGADLPGCLAAGGVTPGGEEGAAGQRGQAPRRIE